MIVNRERTERSNGLNQILIILQNDFCKLIIAHDLALIMSRENNSPQLNSFTSIIVNTS